MSNLIDITEFSKVDLRVGYVKHAEKVPHSKNLIKLIVDLGTEERQIIAGLARWYSPEELKGKYVIVVANLKPKRFMGLESQGMILATCSEEGGRPILLTVAEPTKPGSKVC
ncbi:MAG: methionine--tRNA ligase subunit beta [Desulfurococcales archaeon]|nr:methionine--tRNA ligase subunit beta [Desulfurococcales archaeon]